MNVPVVVQTPTGSTGGKFDFDGETYYLKSAEAEPGLSLKNDPDILTDADSWKHFEGHVGAIMKKADIKELTVTINNPSGPCRSCQLNVGKYLPNGAKLHVRYINNQGQWITKTIPEE